LSLAVLMACVDPGSPRRERPDLSGERSYALRFIDNRRIPDTLTLGPTTAEAQLHTVESGNLHVQLLNGAPAFGDWALTSRRHSDNAISTYGFAFFTLKPDSLELGIGDILWFAGRQRGDTIDIRGVNDVGISSKIGGAHRWRFVLEPSNP
jgi:hypothetical protein